MSTHNRNFFHCVQLFANFVNAFPVLVIFGVYELQDQIKFIVDPIHRLDGFFPIRHDIPFRCPLQNQYILFRIVCQPFNVIIYYVRKIFRQIVFCIQKFISLIFFRRILENIRIYLIKCFKLTVIYTIYIFIK